VRRKLEVAIDLVVPEGVEVENDTLKVDYQYVRGRG